MFVWMVFQLALCCVAKAVSACLAMHHGETPKGHTPDARAGHMPGVEECIEGVTTVTSRRRQTVMCQALPSVGLSSDGGSLLLYVYWRYLMWGQLVAYQ